MTPPNTPPARPPADRRRTPARRVGARAGQACALATTLLVLGCNGGGSGAPSGGPTFVAFASDFNGFRDWSSAPAMQASTLPPLDAGDGTNGLGAADGGAADAGIHGGPLTVYWKAPPPHGATTFPLGTIIVKEPSDGDLTTRQIFAMVKRGGDFNPTGAVNWEWFELQNVDSATVQIVWRGFGPPAGETYGGNPAFCNGCHVIAAGNDDVWSSALQLTNF